ncbi:MAG: UvrD-helicase domain-containing protein, partial [Acidobacteriota bacterium]
PLPFFPDSARAYVEKLKGSSDEDVHEKALARALEVYRQEKPVPGAALNPYVRQVFGETNPLSSRFQPPPPVPQGYLDFPTPAGAQTRSDGGKKMIRRFDPLSIPLTGTHLIEAGAGTGKTYAITGLVVRLLVERGWPVDRILVVTYTRAAMAELRERVRTRIQEGLAALQAGGDPEDDLLDHLARRSRAAGTVHRDGRRLASALSSFDQAAILTIHGFCRKMLADSAFESGLPFDTEFLENQALLVREIAHDFWVGRMMEAPASLVRFLTERKASQQVRPDTLVCLATKAADHREMPLVPGRPAPADPGAEKAWHTAYVQAAGIWREEKDPVIDLLCRSQALNRNKYRAASIRGLWAVQMDALMSSAVPPIPESFQRFVKFTPAELQEGCKKGRTPPEHPFFAACEALKKADDRCRADFEARETALHLDLVEFARAEMVRRKERDGSRTFDDLLYLMRDGVRSPEGEQLRAFLRARFFAVLIDEFQDTDPVQYELFHEVYHQEAGGSDAALFLIGDPKQAIYAFRGADIFTYMEARRQAGGHLHSLQTNWRSDAKLIRAVNTLYGRTRRPFFMETVAFKPVEPAPPGAERCGED